MGYLVHLDFINSGVCQKVLSKDDLIQKVSWGLNDELSDSEKLAKRLMISLRFGL